MAFQNCIPFLLWRVTPWTEYVLQGASGPPLLTDAQPWVPPLLSFHPLQGQRGQWGLWILILGCENILLVGYYGSLIHMFGGMVLSMACSSQSGKWASWLGKRASLGGGQPQRPQRERTALPQSSVKQGVEADEPDVRIAVLLEPAFLLDSASSSSSFFF